jgi:pyruvate formate lyase activating enzyme
MRIGGLQKTSLLDFPGKVAAVVFTQGCNFLCPYCHNAELIPHRDALLAQADVLGFLAQRRRLLEGVVISGGEPTLQEGLGGFCAVLKNLGYAIKLDTNGGRPTVVRRLLRSGLLDYVAMDVKAAPGGYPREISLGGPGSAIGETMALLRESGIPHEFRIPCVYPFVTEEAFGEILDVVGDAPVFLQAVRLERVSAPTFFERKGRALREEEMQRLRQTAERRGVTCHVR